MKPFIVMDQSVLVDVGGGACMNMPRGCLEWNLRYGTLDNLEAVRFQAAGAMETLCYLVYECSRDEAWRRIKLMRAAMVGVSDE